MASGRQSPTVIYHNPRCTTSRKTLELLRDNGIEPTIVRVSEDAAVPRRVGRP